MTDELYTFVAGGALEAGKVFNVKCNCGGNAPITPASDKGYGFSKHGPEVKMVEALPKNWHLPRNSTFCPKTPKYNIRFLATSHPRTPEPPRLELFVR